MYVCIVFIDSTIQQKLRRHEIRTTEWGFGVFLAFINFAGNHCALIRYIGLATPSASNQTAMSREYQKLVELIRAIGSLVE